MTSPHFAITISHQVGSGAAYIGRKLSERLKIPCFDREILKAVADQLNLAEHALLNREERITSFWQSLTQLARIADPSECMALDTYIPSDKELFQLETETILQIVEKTPAIFIGRCGAYALRNQPNRLSIFTHADITWRIERVHTIYCLSEDEARKYIAKNDRERAAYFQTFTKQNWLNSESYDLCIDTSRIGLDKSVELILEYCQGKNIS